MGESIYLSKIAGLLFWINPKGNTQQGRRGKKAC